MKKYAIGEICWAMPTGDLADLTDTRTEAEVVGYCDVRIGDFFCEYEIHLPAFPFPHIWASPENQLRKKEQPADDDFIEMFKSLDQPEKVTA